MSRRIEVQLIGDDASLQRMFKRAEVGASAFNGAIGTLRVGLASLAKSFIFIEALNKALEGLSASVHLGIDEFKDNVKIQAQTQAALKATGNAAHTSASQIDELGLKLSNLSGVDDEVVRLGENTLLAFTNIRNFAGKGNQIFDEATKSALNFSVRTGRGIQASAVAIGRALQDPAKAAGSLRRAYVVLTDSEKKAIASALNHGDVLKAQRDILGDLEKRYGGAAAAAGKTLPGALNVLKDRFKDLLGEGISKVSPSLTKATRSLADFVVKLSGAKSFTAGFNIVLKGAAHLGENIVKQIPRLDRAIFNAIKHEIESIDWSQLAASGQKAAGRIAATIGARLRAIDWRREISTAGRKLGDAIVDALHGLNDAIRRVDWNKVGQDIAKGIGLAIGAVVVFIKNLNLSRITHALFDVLGAALLAAARLLEGVGQALGQAILKGIEVGLNKAKNAVVKVADEVVLKIIAPFKLLGHIGADPFGGLRSSLEASLAKMAADAATGGQQIGANLAAGVGDPFTNLFSAITNQVNTLVSNAKKAAAANATATGPDKLPAPPAATGLAARKGITASQRNSFFDNAIGRILQRGGLKDLQGQLASIEQASALISARLAATKDITRKLNLEDQLLQLASQATQLRQQIADNFIAGLQLNLTKAQATNGLGDDLALLRKIQTGLRAEIREFGTTADLQSQLFDIAQQIKQTKLTDITRKEFFTLGLGPTGDTRVPLAASLRKQLGTLQDAVKGTFLDTAKTKSEFKNIAKVLSEAIIPSDVRSKIADLFAQIRGELQKGSHDLTKFKHVNSDAILAGLGLSPDQMRALRQRIAQIGSNGSIPGVTSPAFSLAGGGTIQVNSVLKLGERELGRAVTTHQVKEPRRLPSRRN